MRLDLELVSRGLANTRSKAQETIKNGHVYLNGKLVTKNSLLVRADDTLTLDNDVLKYVSRAGLKLEKAIDTFGIILKNKVMCDIGSSTGGFTDCALQNEIEKVIAIDVGTNQLDEKLKLNSKVQLYENMDFRNVDVNILNGVDIITMDVSFISVKKLMSKIFEVNNIKEIVCLIKPQFECGKEIADKYKGIVLDKNVHNSVIKDIIDSFNDIGFYAQGLTYSPIKGGSGNIDYLLYLNKDMPKTININQIINEAFKL